MTALMAKCVKTKVKTHRGKWGAARSHLSSQGFVPLKSGENIFGAGWTAKCESAQLDYTEPCLLGPAGIRPDSEVCCKLLTEAVKSIIRENINAGRYIDRDGQVEPPFMAPSDNPDRYPFVSCQSLSLSDHPLILQKVVLFL